MTWEVRRRTDSYHGVRVRARTSKKAAILFINQSERPIFKGNVAEDFAWRREVSYVALCKDPELVALVEKELGISGAELKFDRHAGCSMCPCSPGIVVRGEMQFRSKTPALWLESAK